MSSESDSTIDLIGRWIEDCVLGLSLCPYARIPWENGEVRITICEQRKDYLQHINSQASELLSSSVETVLIILQNGLSDFLDFNDFLDDVEQLLVELDLEGQLQLASFHPGYLFADEAADDASNYTNRAPVPIVQLLRVESVSKAVDAGNTLAIPERNMQTLRSFDRKSLQALFPWAG
ncbi:hypothetical protein AB833_07805 [Chromatiales bacterium (ex Bugula neritina AB1)]|nr:hypothetical protein AB833_07805 [Chromatiales bacterium (ex Bugula neritina AB1)]